MQTFTEGNCYPFDVLTAEFGRATSYVLRNKKEKVTAFILKKEMNPSTEDGLGKQDIFIVVAKGSLRESIPGGILLKRGYPVFVQENTNSWRCLGRYFYLGESRDPKLVFEHSKNASEKLADIACILTLKKASVSQAVAA